MEYGAHPEVRDPLLVMEIAMGHPVEIMRRGLGFRRHQVEADYVYPGAALGVRHHESRIEEHIGRGIPIGFLPMVHRAVEGCKGVAIGLRQGRDSGSSCEKSGRAEEHTSELQALMRIWYAVFCLKKKKNN